jgi:probable F420-dependent oxidoreductase
MAEERGFESLLFPEHTHIPAARQTPYPAGGELPPEYSRLYDPFVALTAAAAATERIRIGTGICLVIQRDPIVTAKEVASLDRLSGGRFLFGVGAGWKVQEMRDHGTEPSRRFGVMRERVEAMKAIWAQDEASYSGRHVNFDRIWSWPKPLQVPRPADPRRRQWPQGDRPRARPRPRRRRTGGRAASRAQGAAPPR